MSGLLAWLALGFSSGAVIVAIDDLRRLRRADRKLASAESHLRAVADIANRHRQDSEARLVVLRPVVGQSDRAVI